MMKRLYIFSLALVAMMMVSTAASAQKSKYEFEYPPYIADSAKKTFVKDFKQGSVLYQLSCAKCHNTKTEGKEVIPDFSLPQLMDYEMRMYPEHGDQLTDKFVSDPDMNKIVTFLRYKKKSGVKFLGNPSPAP